MDTMADSHVVSDYVVEPQPLRRSHREHRPAVWMKDYVGHTSTSTMLSYSTSTTPHIFPFVISPNHSDTYVAYLFNASTCHEPASYKEACKFPEWV